MQSSEVAIIRKAALVVTHDKKVLLVRSAKNEEVFYFPGGKYEEGESDEECLRREIQEELGTEVSELKFLEEFIDWAHGRENAKVLIRLYAGRLSSEPQASSEIAELQYFDTTMALRNTNIAGARVMYWLRDNDYIA